MSLEETGSIGPDDSAELAAAQPEAAEPVDRLTGSDLDRHDRVVAEGDVRGMKIEEIPDREPADGFGQSHADEDLAA